MSHLSVLLVRCNPKYTGHELVESVDSLHATAGFVRVDGRRRGELIGYATRVVNGWIALNGDFDLYGLALRLSLEAPVVDVSDCSISLLDRGEHAGWFGPEGEAELPDTRLQFLVGDRTFQDFATAWRAKIHALMDPSTDQSACLSKSGRPVAEFAAWFKVDPRLVEPELFPGRRVLKYSRRPGLPPIDPLDVGRA